MLRTSAFLYLLCTFYQCVYKYTSAFLICYVHATNACTGSKRAGTAAELQGPKNIFIRLFK